MTALLTIVAGLCVAGVAWRWSVSSIDGASRVALVVVLAMTAATFNVVVPIYSVEATTSIVLCAAIALGARTGIATGIVAVVASSVTGGIGVWTIWMSVAVVAVAVVGALVGATSRSRDWFAPGAMLRLAVAAAAATIAWDVITTVGGLASYAPPGLTFAQSLMAAMLTGAMFTVTHVVWVVWLTALGGPPLLHALQRARPRLDGGLVID